MFKVLFKGKGIQSLFDSCIYVKNILWIIGHGKVKRGTGCLCAHDLDSNNGLMPEFPSIEGGAGGAAAGAGRPRPRCPRRAGC